MIDATTRAALDRLLDPWRRSDAPGLILAVGRGGRIEYAAAAGMASLEHGVALRPDHRMAIGSISKHFTAAALLALQDRGLLSLQDQIGRHVPELSEPQRAPTLDQLLRMSGGLRCYLDVSVSGGLSTLPTGTVLATQCRQTAVNFPPGAATVYCNGGYHLASVALMRATGRGFDDLMREHVFEPFGLARTVAPSDVWRVDAGLACPYVPYRGGWRRGLPLEEDFLGDGCVQSTAADLVRWAAALRRGQGAQGPIHLATLTAPQALLNGHVPGYRRGLVDEPWRGTRLVSHGGAVMGATAFLAMLPDHDLDVVVLANRPLDVQDVALQAAAAVLGDRIEPATAEPLAADHADLLDRDFLEPETGLLLRFVAEGEGQAARIVVHRMGAPAGPACPLDSASAQSRPVAQPAGGRLPFTVGQGDRALHLGVVARDGRGVAEIAIGESGAWRTAVRLDARAPTVAEVAAQLTGVYRCDEAGVTLRFVAEGDRLSVLRLDGPECRVAGAAPVAPGLLRAWLDDLPGGALWRYDPDAPSVDQIAWTTARVRRLVFERIDA
jgi:CubicO group peptidase (beta-lactamase class C family)